MNRLQLTHYIAEQYGAQAEYLWLKYPNYAVFRRGEGGKWFALMMDVPKRKLGIAEDGTLDVICVKCDPLLIGSFLQQKGFFPAYRMSKASWITAALDGSVPDTQLTWLLETSFALTHTAAKHG